MRLSHFELNIPHVIELCWITGSFCFFSILDMTTEEISISNGNETSWLTVSSLDSELSEQEFKENEDPSLDDTLPIDILDEDNEGVHKEPLKSGMKVFNRTYVINKPQMTRYSSTCEDCSATSNLKLPETSSEFHPITCSSRFPSLGKGHCDSSDFNPNLCSTRYFSNGTVNIRSPKIQSTGISRRQSSTTSEFNPPFSSTCQSTCRSPGLFLPRLQQTAKSDLSEFYPPVSSTKLRLEMRPSPNRGSIGLSDPHFGSLNADTFNMQKISTPVSHNANNFDTRSLDFNPQFYSTATRSSSFLPLRCSSALNESHIFNPPISSTAVLGESSNISETAALKLDNTSSNISGFANLKLNSKSSNLSAMCRLCIESRSSQMK